MADELAALRRDYGARLPARVARLAELGRQTRARRELLDEAIQEAHRLYGTAGSYGFLSVSEAAGRLEQALAEVRDSQGRQGEQSWDAVERAVDALAKTVTAS